MIRYSNNLIIIVLFAILVCTPNLGVQAIDIKGRVLDNNNNPIFAASIFLNSKKHITTESDINGEFILHDADFEGKDSIVIYAFGYTERKIPVDHILYKSYNIVLTEEISLNEIIVKAQNPISKFISISQIDSYDIYMNPIAQGDALQAVVSLPSSTSVNENSEPSFRGSYGGSSVVVLNGFPISNAAKVNKLNHYGSFGIFNPEVLKKQYVYAGNPPLIYGNTTAGLVELETIDNIDKNSYNIGLNLCGLSFLLSQKIDNKSYIQSFGNCMCSTLMKEMQPKSFPEMKNFMTEDICITGGYKIADNFMFKSYNYLNIDNYLGIYDSFGYNGDISTNNKKIFTINNGKLLISKGLINFTQGYEYSKSRFSYGNMYYNESTTKGLISTNTKLYLNNMLSIQTGIDYFINTYKVHDSIPVCYYAIFPKHPSYSVKGNLSNNRIDGYVCVNYDINDNISTFLGARSRIVPIAKKDNTSYQASVKYRCKKHNFMISAGNYNRTMGPYEYYMHVKQSQSFQLSTDYVYYMPNVELYGAAYHKESNDLLYINEENNAGLYKVRTFGVEFSFKYSFASYFTFYVANSFVNQKMKRDNKEWRTGTYNLLYNFKTYLSFVNPRIGNLSISYTSRPGLCYTPICDAALNETYKVYKPVYGQQNSENYTSYNKIDVSYSKTIDFGNYRGLLYMSVNNLLNSNNVMNNIYDEEYNLKSQRVYQKRILFMGISFMF